MSGAPDFKAERLEKTHGTKKKYRRQVAGRKRWEAIRADKLGPCIVCTWLDEKQPSPSTLHHVVPRDRNGADTEANLVSLCGSGMTGHHGKVEAGDEYVCRTFVDALANLDGDAYSYATSKLGEEGFLRLYRVRFEAA